VLSNNLCVDVKLQTTADDDVCLLDRPNVDDRTYGVSPYPGLGFRFTVFPGAFGRNQGWWAHVGLYADFARSLNLKTSKDYEGVDSNSLRVWVPTYQQDLRAGIVARIPLGSPVRPQFRVAAGVGFFELFLDDEAYPDDREITLAFRPANPYIPSFAYLTADVGLELRIPFRIEPLAYIFPYSSVFYRRGIDYFNRVVAGADVISQAARVYGVSAAVNGVDWELGARLELALGIRIHVAFNLLWYGTDFAGNADYASEEEEALWNQTALGNRAQEMLVRLRLGVGWSF
jgi:hypothetical protein